MLRQVWGSAATAALCALGTAVWPTRAVMLRLAFVASLSTKLSDTCASEIGKAFGRTSAAEGLEFSLADWRSATHGCPAPTRSRTYLITTFQRVLPGTEGAVSLEGTLAGAVGSLVLASYAVGCGLMGLSAVAPCLVAAFVATNVESLIGASAQGRFGWLTNEVVNFIMTVIGAACGISLAIALRLA